MRKLRALAARLLALEPPDLRDVLALAGVGLICYGGERLYPGAGFTAAGLVLVAVAAAVR